MCQANYNYKITACSILLLFAGNVTCSDIGFECPEGNGTCISRKQLCDGKNDCGDNTDEDIANCIWAGRVPGMTNSSQPQLNFTQRS